MSYLGNFNYHGLPGSRAHGLSLPMTTLPLAQIRHPVHHPHRPTPVARVGAAAVAPPAPHPISRRPAPVQRPPAVTPPLRMPIEAPLTSSSTPIPTPTVPPPEEVMDTSSVAPTVHATCFHPDHPKIPVIVTADSDGSLSVLQSKADEQKCFQVVCPTTSLHDMVCDSEVVALAGDAVVLYLWSALLDGVKGSTITAKSPDDTDKDKLPKNVVEVAPVAICPLPESSAAVSLFLQDDELYVGDSAGQVTVYGLTSLKSGTVKISEGPWALHASSVTGIRISSSGQLITCSNDGTVCFSSVRKGANEATQIIPCILTDNTAPSRGVKRGASGDPIPEGEGLLSFAVTSIDIDSDRLWLVIGGDVPYVSLFNLITKRLQRIITLPNADWRVKCVRFLKSLIVVGVDDNMVLLYSLLGELRDSRTSISDTVHSIAIAPGGTCWAASGKNTNVEIYSDM
eukprot:Sspe_Gene.103307::Locus_79126_Transcript_3_3_Confidence_0.600_Length_1494::g.103307::m.103307